MLFFQEFAKFIFIGKEGLRDAETVFHLRVVPFLDSRHGVFVACPASSGHTAHHIPEHSLAEDIVDAVAAVANHAEAAVDGFADSDAAAIMKRHEAHASCAVAGETLHSHIGHDVRTVFDIGGLAER